MDAPRRAPIVFAAAAVAAAALLLGAGPASAEARLRAVRFVEAAGVAREVAADRLIAVLPADTASWGGLRDSVAGLGYRTERVIEDARGLVIGLPEGTDLSAACARIRGEIPALSTVGPVGIVQPFASVPNDPFYAQQWQHAAIRATLAWDEFRTAGEIGADLSEVTIAVIDTGVDYFHPDLSGAIARRFDYGRDADGNGYIGDDYGFDFIDGVGNVNDADGALDGGAHGTHVAGIAAAVTANALGVSGVAGGWAADAIGGARILPVRVLGPLGGTTDGVAAGIVYAAKCGARVANLSLGLPMCASAGEADGTIIQNAVNFARSKGCVIVASAGNDACVPQEWHTMAGPNLSGIVVVAATDSADDPADFSNFGPTIDVAAPGVDILSSVPTYDIPGEGYVADSGYDVYSGTSMAAPVVTGIVAAILAKNGFLSPIEVEDILRGTARDPEGDGVDEHTGWGIVDFDAALDEVEGLGLFLDEVGGARRAMTYPNPYLPGQGGALRFSTNDFLETIRTVRIYTLDGRRVCTLAPTEARLVLDWDGRNDHGHLLASGVYVYELTTADEKRLTGRFTLVR